MGENTVSIGSLLSRLGSQVGQGRQLCYQSHVHSNYDLKASKAMCYICIFIQFYDKHIYFLHTECSGSPEPIIFMKP